MTDKAQSVIDSALGTEKLREDLVRERKDRYKALKDKFDMTVAIAMEQGVGVFALSQAGVSPSTLRENGNRGKMLLRWKSEGKG